MDTNRGVVYRFSESELALDQFADDVEKGLGSQSKYLKPKYFYDQIGSKIFEQICIQPEYYITHIESDILRNNSPNIVSMCNGDISIVELGSGSSSKTRILLEHTLEKQTFLYYFPIDVSHNILHQTVRNLSSDFSNLRTDRDFFRLCYWYRKGYGVNYYSISCYIKKTNTFFRIEHRKF